MRDLHLPGRSVVHCVNGAAATSHPLSTMAAIDMLRRGGNAIDAAVAACAVQCVVEPMSTGVGGDCFVLYAPGGGPDVIALNGSGRAPAGLSAEYLSDRGIDSIGISSPHAVTVPGAVDAWARLVADHGTRGLDEILVDAIEFAEQGFAVTPRVAIDWARSHDKLAADPGARRIFLPGGRAPEEGARHRQPELAGTLKAIAARGRAGFYEGPVAEDIVDCLRSRGGVHTLDDFAAQTSEYVTPISTSYGDAEIVQIPPNGQGITTLVMLNILAGFDLAALDPVGAARLHLETEAGRLAFRMRDSFLGDPAQAEIPIARLLTSEYADELRGAIDPGRARPAETSGDTVYRDTVYLTVVDRDRNAVSFINSLYYAFGSGLVAPRSGVVLQNRGAGFVVEPGHPNCVAPGKRPKHTIIPGMVLKDGRATLSFGVMGGDYQPVGHVHVLANLLDYGMDIQEALDCPRVFHRAGTLEVERGISPEVAAALADLGHAVECPDMPIGGGQAIAIDWQRGTFAAASDPRKDGCALGY